MSLQPIITLLIAERTAIDNAIRALGGVGKGSDASPVKRAERSPESRAAQSEKMKAYWAKRAQEKGGKKKATKKHRQQS